MRMVCSGDVLTTVEWFGGVNYNNEKDYLNIWYLVKFWGKITFVNK